MDFYIGLRLIWKHHVHIWSWRAKKRKQTQSARNGGMQIGIFKVD